MAAQLTVVLNKQQREQNGQSVYLGELMGRTCIPVHHVCITRIHAGLLHSKVHKDLNGNHIYMQCGSRVHMGTRGTF